MSEVELQVLDRDVVDVFEGNTTRTISLAYPLHWFAPIQLPCYAKTAEEETIRWMSDLNLMPGTHILQNVRHMEPRHYAGYSHSMASYEYLLLYSKYITMWLLWDDECVENNGNQERIAYILDALAGDELSSVYMNDPYVRAFQHLGDEYERLGASRHWRKRFATSMKEWADHALVESHIRNTLPQDCPNRPFNEAIKLRAVTVGIRPNSIPLERAVGIEIPDEINQSDDFKLLVDQAALICCIVNDIVGVPKDIQNMQITSNLVLYHRTYFNTTLCDSYTAILHLHDDAVKRYDQLSDTILDKIPIAWRERMQAFFNQLRYMDSGFGFWHRDCVRYQKLVALEGNVVFQAAISVL